MRAIAWKLTGDRLKATRASAVMGQVFAYILIGLGLYALLLTDALLSGLWLAVLGWFLLQAARGTVAQTAFSERLGGVTVADIMDSEPVSILAAVTATGALDEYFCATAGPGSRWSTRPGASWASSTRSASRAPSAWATATGPCAS